MTRVKLEQALENVSDLHGGPDGHLYVLAGRTIVKMNARGQIVRRIGFDTVADAYRIFLNQAMKAERPRRWRTRWPVM